MGLSITSLLGALVGSVPIPGAGAVGSLIAGIGSGGGGASIPGLTGNFLPPGSPVGVNENNPFIPDFIENVIEGVPQQGLPIPQAGGADCVTVTAPAQIEQRIKCPPGYVSVTCNGAKMCMLKPVARSLGLWKARRRPPISASEWRQFKTAERVEKKMIRIAKGAGMRSPTRRRKAS